MQKERDITFDVLKGIGILSVMLCHLVYNDGLIRKVVYSFHMPLFFLISGYFVKDANCFVDFLNLTKRNARRLLLPFSVTMFMLVVWGAVQAYAKQDIAFFIRPLLSLVLANADPINTQWGMPYAGCLWFLVALFVARECFALLQMALRNVSSKCRSHIILVICIVISWLVSVIHPRMVSLPFSIAQGLTALVFVAAGWYVRQTPNVAEWVKWLCVLCWPLSIMYGGINMESCTLSAYPLSVSGACGAVFLLYRVFSLEKMKGNVFSRCLTWCGINSLVILCMHHLEMYSSVIYSLQCRIPQVYYLIGYGEVLVAIVLATVVLKIPGLKNVYK